MLANLDYFFWVVALGTGLLGLVSGVIGTAIVLEKQSQLGDAIGHSVYPGIIVAFMIFQTRNTMVLLSGAILAGVCAFAMIEFIRKHSHFPYESILALILSSFFSIGLLLYQIVQKNPQYQQINFSGLDKYIMGQAAFLLKLDVQIIAIVSVSILIIFFLFYPKIKVYLFDKIFTASIGISRKIINLLLLLMTLLVIVIGLQAVGAILISSMLVAPAIAASLWTNSYPKMIIYSGMIGLISGVIGSLLSTQMSDLATGPTIVVILSLISFMSLIFAPNGLLGYKLYQRGEQK